jgi:hypothetical protein
VASRVGIGFSRLQRDRYGAETAPMKSNTSRRRPVRDDGARTRQQRFLSAAPGRPVLQRRA